MRCPVTVGAEQTRVVAGVLHAPLSAPSVKRLPIAARFVHKLFGLPERVLCDNGPPWSARAAEEVLGGRHTRLTVWMLRLGAAPVHGRVFHPQDSVLNCANFDKEGSPARRW